MHILASGLQQLQSPPPGWDVLGSSSRARELMELPSAEGLWGYPLHLLGLIMPSKAPIRGSAAEERFVGCRLVG